MRDNDIRLSTVNGAPATPAAGIAQTVLGMLGRAERLIDIDPGQAKAFIDRASRLLTPAPTAVAPPAMRSSLALAPWQERKVARHISENLAQPISNQSLAASVGLSVGHFSRRFKSSFGVSPRDYVVLGRLERAKSLMTRTNAPLSQIALDSGFCDQAHMCRTFHQVVGSTPGRWRRENRLGLTG